MKQTPLSKVPLEEQERLIDNWIVRADYRAIIKERLLNGTGFKEIAAKSGFTERHVKNIVYKGEEQLFTHI